MGSRYKGTPEEVAALDAYIKLMRAAESVTSRVMPVLTEAQLSMSQFGVLEALYHLGPLCQRDLGQKILKSSGNVTQVVDNLEKRGLVQRERESGDRRYITVRLTDQGRALLDDLLPRHVAAIRSDMDVLTSPELGELGRLCRRLGLQE